MSRTAASFPEVRQFVSPFARPGRRVCRTLLPIMMGNRPVAVPRLAPPAPASAEAVCLLLMGSPPVADLCSRPPSHRPRGGCPDALHGPSTPLPAPARRSSDAGGGDGAGARSAATMSRVHCGGRLAGLRGVGTPPPTHTLPSVAGGAHAVAAAVGLCAPRVGAAPER